MNISVPDYHRYVVVVAIDTIFRLRGPLRRAQQPRAATAAGETTRGQAWVKGANGSLAETAAGLPAMGEKELSQNAEKLSQTEPFASHGSILVSQNLRAGLKSRKLDDSPATSAGFGRSSSFSWLLRRGKRPAKAGTPNAELKGREKAHQAGA